MFFSGPLGGEIIIFKFPPPNNNKFKQPAGCFSHFLSPQKQFPPLNDISRKNPGCATQTTCERQATLQQESTCECKRMAAKNPEEGELSLQQMRDRLASKIPEERKAKL